MQLLKTIYRSTLVVCIVDKSFSPSPPAVFNAICLVAVYDDHCPAAVAHIAHVAVAPPFSEGGHSLFNTVIIIIIIAVVCVLCDLQFNDPCYGAGVDCKITLGGQTTEEAVLDVLAAKIKRSVRQKQKLPKS